MPQLKAFSLGIVFAVAAVGFAFAMPHSLLSGPGAEKKAAEETGETHGSNAGARNDHDRGKGPKKADTASGSGGDYHGQVVKIAAHCDVTGRAHGELVRSIAEDKDATVAGALAACEAAIAAQGSAAAAAGTHNATGKASAHRQDKAPRSKGAASHGPDSNDSGSGSSNGSGSGGSDNSGSGGSDNSGSGSSNGSGSGGSDNSGSGGSGSSGSDDSGSGGSGSSGGSSGGSASSGGKDKK